MKPFKSKVIKLVDLFAFVLISVLISTGSVLKFALPAGSGQDALWGLTRHQWGDIHFYISLAFLLLIVAHLLLHARFIKKTVEGKRWQHRTLRSRITLAILFVFIVLLIMPFFAPVDRELTGKGSGRHSSEHFKPLSETGDRYHLMI